MASVSSNRRDTCAWRLGALIIASKVTAARLHVADRIPEVTNIGKFGKEFALVTSSALAQRGTRKLKGSFNNGTLSPTINLDPDDAGQTILETLLENDDPRTFFDVLLDGATYGLEALVMTFRPSVARLQRGHRHLQPRSHAQYGGEDRRLLTLTATGPKAVRREGWFRPCRPI